MVTTRTYLTTMRDRRETLEDIHRAQAQLEKGQGLAHEKARESVLAGLARKR